MQTAFSISCFHASAKMPYGDEPCQAVGKGAHSALLNGIPLYISEERNKAIDSIHMS